MKGTRSEFTFKGCCGVDSDCLSKGQVRRREHTWNNSNSIGSPSLLSFVPIIRETQYVGRGNLFKKVEIGRHLFSDSAVYAKEMLL